MSDTFATVSIHVRDTDITAVPSQTMAGWALATVRLGGDITGHRLVFADPGVAEACAAACHEAAALLCGEAGAS